MKTEIDLIFQATKHKLVKSRPLNSESENLMQRHYYVRRHPDLGERSS